MTTGQVKIVCATKTCQAHISGPADAPATAISHGICPACLKRDHPGAYYFGRRRALAERLGALRADTDNQLNLLAFAGVRS